MCPEEEKGQAFNWLVGILVGILLSVSIWFSLIVIYLLYEIHLFGMMPGVMCGIACIILFINNRKIKQDIKKEGTFVEIHPKEVLAMDLLYTRKDVKILEEKIGALRMVIDRCPNCRKELKEIKLKDVYILPDMKKKIEEWGH